jgi:uncharacterized protein YfaS (alpha-2-macroglobulin family)
VREDVPETLVFAPEVITDANGNARLSIPQMADSITTWRFDVDAVTRDGRYGKTTARVRVFQDFFVDMRVPPSLTEGDHVTVVAQVYNYLPTAQKVSLSLDAQAWFTAEFAERTIEIPADDGSGSNVAAVPFLIDAKTIGHHKLTLRANGEVASDAVRRPVIVTPNGRRREAVTNTIARGPFAKTVDIPKNVINGSASLICRVYPGAASQAIDGLEGMLSCPHG